MSVCWSESYEPVIKKEKREESENYDRDLSLAHFLYLYVRICLFVSAFLGTCPKTLDLGASTSLEKEL